MKNYLLWDLTTGFPTVNQIIQGLLTSGKLISD